MSSRRGLAMPPPIAPYSGEVAHLVREHRHPVAVAVVALDGSARTLTLAQLHFLADHVQQLVRGHLAGLPRPWDDDLDRIPFATRPAGRAPAPGTGRNPNAPPSRPTPAAGSGS